MIRAVSAILVIFVTAASLAACGNTHTYDPNAVTSTKTVTDDAGRNVKVAETITKIAPSGATATMFLMTIAPDMMVGLAATPSRAQRAYIPEELWYLPTFGQFYGSKSTLNMEALMDAEPQIIIDTGDRKGTIKTDMDYIQAQTRIPTVFFEADLVHMASAYRKLGELLGREDVAEERAQFVEKTVAMAKEKSALIPDDEKVTIMYGTGSAGLSVHDEESSQAQVIELIGARNAVVLDTVSSGGGTLLSMEGVYKIEPDVIILAAGGPYADMQTNEWSELKAVKEGRYYEIPSLPYNWVSAPPSVNMVLGVWWLGQLVYPEYYSDYDIVEVAKEYYDLFWHYELTDEEAEEMLSRSILK